MQIKRFIILFTFLFPAYKCYCSLKVATIFSSHMVIQRNCPIKIWGSGITGKSVSVKFRGDEYETTVDNKGNWLVLTAPYFAGGPYDMIIQSDSQKVILEDLLVGDVWLCSGQSNMHMKMKSVKKNFPEEFKISKIDEIRYIEVPSQLNFHEEASDIKPSKWNKINSKSIYNVSAAAYFFAKEIQRKLNIPIGLIISAVGGSPVESWMSEESALKYEMVSKRLNEARLDGFLDSLEKKNQSDLRDWINIANKKIFQKDTIYNSKFFNHTYKYKKQPFHSQTGVYWFKNEFIIDDPSLSNTHLYLGKIGDFDSTFLNGVFIGTRKLRYVDRDYWFSSDLLKKGKNKLEVKVYNYRWRAGFMFGDMLELKSKQKKIEIMDDWQYADLCEMPVLEPAENRFWRPVGLYNGMIAPLRDVKIKGVIWYQGEANAKRDLAYVYRDRFLDMINDWRDLFKNKDLPFLFVQLPNFQKPNPNPYNSSWAMLRESQLVVSKLNNNGMITSIDVGEAYDIHPKNKKDIGLRLAMEAMRIAYDDNSPKKFTSYVQEIYFKENKAMVKFTNSKLNFIGIDIHSNVAVAGQDKKFHWAKVILKNGVLTAHSDAVKNPIAIRYAWSDNPGIPLIYNEFNLPISPFRSDDW